MMKIIQISNAHLDENYFRPQLELKAHTRFMTILYTVE